MNNSRQVLRRPCPRAALPSFPLNLFLCAFAPSCLAEAFQRRRVREKYWDPNNLSPALSAKQTHLANRKLAPLKPLGICPRQTAVIPRHTKKLNRGIGAGSPGHFENAEGVLSFSPGLPRVSGATPGHRPLTPRPGCPAPAGRRESRSHGMSAAPYRQSNGCPIFLLQALPSCSKVNQGNPRLFPEKKDCLFL
jgi:hypothetical protein